MVPEPSETATVSYHDGSSSGAPVGLQTKGGSNSSDRDWGNGADSLSGLKQRKTQGLGQVTTPPPALSQLLAEATPEQIDSAHAWLMSELYELAITAHDRVVIAQSAGQPTYNWFIATEAEARLWWTVYHLPTVYQGTPLPRFPGTRQTRPVSARSVSLFRTVKQAVPVEELAERFTELRPAGPGKLKGKCPLHEERTPSFYVYQDSQRWQCFGACARGGDVVELARRLMDLGKLTRRATKP